VAITLCFEYHLPPTPSLS